MTRLFQIGKTVLLLTLATSKAACDFEAPKEARTSGVVAAMEKNSSRSRAGLPHAQGQSFQTLDEYLSHLRKMGAQDRPYYEKIGDNKYQLITGRGTNLRPPEIFTREMLLKKYGFDE